MTDNRSASSVAYEGLNLAKEAKRDIAAHEEICAERYQTINDKLAEVKGLMKWAGGSAFSVIIAVLAFLAVAQFNANDAARHEQQRKIELLQAELNKR